MIDLNKKELYFFGGLIALFAALAYWVVPWIASAGSIVGYIILTAFFTGITIWVLGWKMSIPVFIALFLVYAVHDVAQPPYLVNQQGILPNLPPEAQISSDVFLWNLLPTSIPGPIKYFMTFVLIPAIILALARLLITKTQFERVAI